VRSLKLRVTMAIGAAAAAVAAAVAAAAMVAVGAPGATADAAGGRAAPTAVGDAALLVRHAPVLRLARGDWGPIPVESFLARATLRVPGRAPLARPGTAELAAAAGVAGARLDIAGCRPAAPQCYQRLRAGLVSARPTAYGRVWRAPGPTSAARTAIVLEYWLLYALNDWQGAVGDIRVRQVHEGDWEAVSVGLAADGHPLWAAWSQHRGGVWRPWARTPKVDGTHPVSRVAAGSHANYPSDGRGGVHAIPPALSGLALFGVLVDRTPTGAAATATVRPRVVPLPVVSGGGSGIPAGWARFSGPWGEGQQILASTLTAPLTAGDSPVGPAQHATWPRPDRIVAGLPQWLRG
jgi:hypothetical protein